MGIKAVEFWVIITKWESSNNLWYAQSVRIH